MGLIGVVLLSLVFAGYASAEIVVHLAGSGSGSVTSEPSGIECSNVGGGAPGPACSGSPNHFGEVKLTATAANDSFFTGWSGSDPASGALSNGPACPSAEDAESCWAIDFAAELTATFAPLPAPPVVATGGSGPGENADLIGLEGTVNPNEFKVAECEFEYGTTTKYGFSAACSPDASALGEGNTAEPVSGQAELEELKPNTTYHYRLTASNIGGTAVGEDRTFITGPAPADGCPNAGIRDTQPFGAIFLPACYGLEMVSPPQKGGQPAYQAYVSSSGDRVRFRSQAALGGTPHVLAVGGDWYVASRESGGWGTAPTVPPGDLVKGWGNTAEPRSFTPDFSQWFQLAATATQNLLGVGQVFHAALGGAFEPLSPTLNPIGSGYREIVEQAEFDGASADQSIVFFTPYNAASASGTAYLSGDPFPDGAAADGNTYVAELNSEGHPSLQLLARDKDQAVWGAACGTRLGGIGSTVAGQPAPNGLRNQGAVSSDGKRVYFSTRPGQPEGEECTGAHKLRILERIEGAQGPWIGYLFGSECTRVSPTCSTADGNDYFQGASTDGSKVFFTTTRQLADSDTDSGSNCVSTIGSSAGCDLYLYDSSLPGGHRLVQVSAGEEEARVLNGTTAISEDGSRVYFVAQRVLTHDHNPEGDEAEAGKPNLYVWDEKLWKEKIEGVKEAEEGGLAFVGTLNPTDRGGGLANEDTGLWGDEGTFRNQAYPAGGADGPILVFGSDAPLTATDADGSHLDVFRYDTDGVALECISCKPGGPDSATVDVTPRGVEGVPGTDYAEEGRWVSEDGNTVALATSEGLVPGDANGARDFYLWRAGRFYRLPGVPYATNKLRRDGPFLSRDGSTVSFQTFSQLVPTDGDSVPDVYVAKIGGGYPEPAPASSCVAGQNCQPSPPQPPGSVDDASSAVSGPGNPRSCRPQARRALVMSHRAKRLRRHAHHAHNPRRARRIRHRARRLAHKARRLSRTAKRCRRANRRAAR